jgi:hypothetical protein
MERIVVGIFTVIGVIVLSSAIGVVVRRLGITKTHINVMFVGGFFALALALLLANGSANENAITVVLGIIGIIVLTFASGAHVYMTYLGGAQRAELAQKAQNQSEIGSVSSDQPPAVSSAAQPATSSGPLSHVIVVRCANASCGKKYTVPSKYVGRQTKCPSCGEVIQIVASHGTNAN